MAALDRVFNIAQTGRIDEPTPVDNIMAQYKPREQAQGGLWNGVKNFVGSNGGRMLLGGLAGAALGGLTGRNINEALTGGIMGATGAANGITRRNQYNDMIAEKRQERADRMAEAEKLRQHQLTMQANTIQANKDAADLEFDRRMAAIREGRDYAEQQKTKGRQEKIDAINGNPYLSDEQKAWQIAQIDIPEFNNDAYYGSMLVRDPNNQDALNYFTNKAKLNRIINPEKLSFTDATKGVSNLSSATNLPAETKNAIAAGYGLETNFIDAPKKYASGPAGLVELRMDKTGEDFYTASYNVGIMSPEEKQALELEKMEKEKELDNQYKLGFELFKSKLPTQAHREALDEAEARGVPVNVIYQEKYDMAQTELAYKKSQTAKNEADTMGKRIANQFVGAEKQAGINQTLANTDKTRAEIPFVGQTSAMKNYNFLQKNPDAVNSPVFAKSGDTINVNTGDNISGGINSKKLIEKTTEAYSNAQENYRESMASRDFTNRAADNLIASLERDPSVVGAYSGWNEKYQRYIGDNKDWLSKRGEVVRQINDIANILIQQANKSGVTGINTVAEVERIVGNINPNSSASEIKGALAKLKVQSEELARKNWDTLQSFNNPLPEYSPYVAQANTAMGQPVQSVGGFIIERID